MKHILDFLKTDGWLVFSNIALFYALTQIIVNKYVIRKHTEKMKFYTPVMSGGNSETWNKEQAAIAYMKTKKYRRIERMKKFF